MKYEAKNGGGGVAVSQPSGLPFTSLNLSDMQTVSNATCEGCHLVTEAEWMTIAQNVLNNPVNWSSGSVGSGYVFFGHSDASPNNSLAADANDDNGYSGTGNFSGDTSYANGVIGNGQKRTLVLSNSEVIWDLSGNVIERTGQVSGGQPGITGAGMGMRQWTAITNPGTMTSSPLPSGTGIAGASTWNSTNGIGYVRSDADTSSTYAISRGGYWAEGAAVGVLYLDLSLLTTNMNGLIGFRVAK